MELVKEYPRGMKNGLNKWEVRTSAASNNRESTVFHFNFFLNKKLAIGTSFAQVKKKIDQARK